MSRLRALCLAVVIAASAATPAGAATGWAPTGSMSGARSWHTATLLANGKVLVAGGDDVGVPLATSELYDPATGTWSPAGRLVTARNAATATLLASGKVLLAGGYGPTAGKATTSVELYDPATNAWSAVGSLQSPHTRHTATLLRDGKVLVAGGEVLPGPGTAAAEIFDPTTNAWTVIPSLGQARYDHAAALLPDGRVLVAGGYNGAFLNSAERYPQPNAWSSAGNLPVARSFLTATALAGGKVLAAGGGVDTSVPVATVDLYDPGANTWTGGPPMAGARYFHAATPLVDGRVLVTGGIGAGGGHVAAAEIYDPGGNAWSPAGTLTNARFAHQATRLADGRVLVTGGVGASFFATAELWTPTTSVASDPAVAFGEQVVGGAVGAAVQITNTGSSPLLVSGLAVGGAQPGDFAVTADRCSGAAVPPGSTCVVDVRFAPTAAGPRAGALTFSANTAAGTHAVTLGGRGVAAAPPAAAVLRRVNVVLSYDYRVGRRSTRFSRLVVRNVPAGSSVTATCATGCARKRYVKRNAKGTVSLKTMVTRAPKAGSRIQVVVALPGAIGAVKTLAIRASKRPSLTTRCLPPGAKSPQSCG